MESNRFLRPSKIIKEDNYKTSSTIRKFRRKKLFVSTSKKRDKIRKLRIL